MSTVASLSVRLMSDTKDLEKGFSKTVKTAAKWGAGLATAAGLAGAAVVGAMTKYGNFADELLDLNAITGLSTNEMQKWRQLATDAGVDTDIMANSIKTLNGQLERGNDLSPRLAKGFETMGVNAEQFKNIDPDEQLRKIVGTMMELEGADKRAFANQMNMADVLPLVAEMEASGKDLEEIMNSIDVPFDESDLGLMNDFRKSWDNFKKKIFEVMGEALMPLFGWFKNNSPKIEGFVQKAFNGIGIAITKVSGFINNEVIPAFQDFSSWIEPHMPMIKQITETTFNAIRIAMEKVIKVVKIIINWFKENETAAQLLGVIIGTAAIAFTAYSVVMWIATTATAAFGAAMAILTSPIFLVIAAIALLAGAVFLVIKNWSKIKSFFFDLWENVKQTFSNAWKGIVSVVRGPANQLIGFANSIIVAFERMLNSVASAVNSIPSFSIPDWVPGIGGKSFGLPNIPSVSLPRVPSLAVGTNMVRNDGLAMLHKGEEVRPANVAGGGFKGGKQEIHVHLDGRELTNVLGPMMVDHIRGKLGSAY